MASGPCLTTGSYCSRSSGRNLETADQPLSEQEVPPQACGGAGKVSVDASARSVVIVVNAVDSCDRRRVLVLRRGAESPVADLGASAPCAAFVDDDGIVVEQRKHRVDVAAGVCFEILRHDVVGGFRRGVLGHGRAKLSERALDACECGDLLEAGLTWTSNLDAGGDAGV